MKIKKVCIVGVGLMGGSFALALKEKFPSFELWGYARNRRSYYKLKKLGLLDRVSSNLKDVVYDSDLVVLGLPIYLIIDYLEKLAPFLKKRCVVMDLGSTKMVVSQKAKEILPKEVFFVGTHPLCGSEKSGAQYASKDLYSDSVCIITSPSQSEGTKLVKRIWERLGAKVYFLSPRLHDELLSLFSHIPHLLAFSLLKIAQKKYKNYFNLTPPSFSVFKRLAESNPDIWTDIFISNRENLIRHIDLFLTTMESFSTILHNRDKKRLKKFLEER